MNAHAVIHLLLALVVIVALSRAAGAVFARLRQPRVVGEMLAGILLGPSLLGRVAPSAWSMLLPADVVAPLGVVAQVGVVLFMFLVGLELDASAVRRAARESLAVSVVSIALPFVLGLGVALALRGSFAPDRAPAHVFVLFVGVAMSVTAFPVLARILVDRRLQKTKLGVMALTSAAFGDVIAWCLLAFVIGLSKASPSGALVTLLLTLGFVVAMLAVVRPMLARVARGYERGTTSPHGATAVVVVGLLASALATEAAGVHALFGAFLFGAILPHDSELAKDLEAKLTDVVVVLLLPAFFAFNGLRTELSLVHGASHWLACGAIVLVASAGKIGGVFVTSRIAGVASRDALALGVLMNTRGLMELVVLNVGLDLGLISPELFAMFIVMALVTTFATSPLLSLVGARAAADEPASDRARAL